jgi:hypothetical protein
VISDNLVQYVFVVLPEVLVDDPSFSKDNVVLSAVFFLASN